MNAHNIKKHLPPSTSTAKGHLNTSRKSAQSTTETQDSKPSVEYTNEMNTPQEEKTHNIFIALGAPYEKGKLYTDLTGKSPINSAAGTRYILIAYDYDSNAIIH